MQPSVRVQASGNPHDLRAALTPGFLGLLLGGLRGVEILGDGHTTDPGGPSPYSSNGAFISRSTADIGL